MTTLPNNHKTTTLRLLHFPNPPTPNPSSSPSFEFQESDLFSSPFPDTPIDTHSVSNSIPNSNSLSISPPKPTAPTNLPRQISHLSSLQGLSAALSNDHHHLLRRKSAVKTIPHREGTGASGVKFHQSAPMNVPVWPKKEMRGKNFDEIEEDEEEDEGDEMVPPHEIVARSHVTFSVFEGVGRTLKGRDLRRVRNAVFQQTGFLD